MVRLSISETLAESGHRLTGSRQDLTDLIGDREGHFTAAELLEEARRRGTRVGRATVFRTLDLLAATGALERIDLPSGEHAYVVCAPQEHHHHVVCRVCGKSAEVPESGLQAVVDRIARRTGYEIDHHRLELFGLCPAHRPRKESRP